jgi:hypothetical protein
MLIPAGSGCQEPSAPSTHFLAGILALAASACASSRKGGADAGQIEKTADGRGRGARGGERPKASLKGASREMVDSMSERQLREFASTKRRGLPRKKSG